MDSDEGQRGAGALRGRRLYFSPNKGGGQRSMVHNGGLIK